VTLAAGQRYRQRDPEFLADGGAEQVPDAVGEGQAERSADDNSQNGAADVAAAQAGAEGTGQAQSDQDGDEGNRYPQVGRGQQDGQHRQQGAGSERQRRCPCGLDGAGDVGGVDVQFGIEMRGQGTAGAQLDGDGVGGGRGKALGFVQGGQLGQFGLWGGSEFAFLLLDLRAFAVALAGDGYVLAQRHRHGPRDQPSQPGGEDGAAV